MFHRYTLLFPLYYYILVLRVYATPLTFCQDLHWAILFYSLLSFHIYKDRSLLSLSSSVNMNALIPITCSTGYRRDPLLFEISDFYCAPITPLYINFRYTWNFSSHRYLSPYSKYYCIVRHFTDSNNCTFANKYIIQCYEYKYYVIVYSCLLCQNTTSIY